MTHHPPRVTPKQDEKLTFTFVTGGVASAVARAKAAAGQLLSAGLVDELIIDVMPVLLGTGLRLFDDAALERVHLEKIGLREVGPRTSLRFRRT